MEKTQVVFSKPGLVGESDNFGSAGQVLGKWDGTGHKEGHPTLPRGIGKSL